MRHGVRFYEIHGLRESEMTRPRSEEGIHTLVTS